MWCSCEAVTRSPDFPIIFAAFAVNIFHMCSIRFRTRNRCFFLKTNDVSPSHIWKKTKNKPSCQAALPFGQVLENFGCHVRFFDLKQKPVLSSQYCRKKTEKVPQTAQTRPLVDVCGWSRVILNGCRFWATPHTLHHPASARQYVPTTSAQCTCRSSNTTNPPASSNASNIPRPAT